MNPGGWSERDSRLSRQLGVGWPHDPLLTALSLFPTAHILDVGAGDGRRLRTLRARGYQGALFGIDPEP